MDEDNRNTSEHHETDTLCRAASSRSTGSELFKKTQVQDIHLVDNVGDHGLYTGTMDTRRLLPHGLGTMDYGDVVYEGQWVNGDWCGFGRLTDLNTGDVYQGGFFDNMKHGLGVRKYVDGRIYDGTFTLEKMEGKGHLTFADDGTKILGESEQGRTPTWAGQ
jgi:hypothetical protein